MPLDGADRPSASRAQPRPQLGLRRPGGGERGNPEGQPRRQQLNSSYFSPPTAGLCASLPCGAPVFPARQWPSPKHRCLRTRPRLGERGDTSPAARRTGTEPVAGAAAGMETGGRPSGDLAAGDARSSLRVPDALQTALQPQLRPSARRRCPPRTASAPTFPGRRRCSALRTGPSCGGLHTARPRRPGNPGEEASCPGRAAAGCAWR